MGDISPFIDALKLLIDYYFLASFIVRILFMNINFFFCLFFWNIIRHLSGQITLKETG